MASSNYYHAPELTLRKYPIIGEKIDVFALAVILFIMQMRREPTEKVSDVTFSKKYQRFCEQKWDLFWPRSLKVSEEFKNLFTLMYHENPAMRASIDQIIEHPWVKNGPVPDPEEI